MPDQIPEICDIHLRLSLSLPPRFDDDDEVEYAS